MAQKVYIMRGLPGSGKSTWVKNFLNDHPHFNVKVVSADDYFIGTDGAYRFNPSRLGAAHGLCKERYIDALENPDVDYVIVDNTNTSAREIEYYLERASGLGVPVAIKEIAGDVDKCAKRNVHGVPKDALVRMAGRLAQALPDEMRGLVEDG